MKWLSSLWAHRSKSANSAVKLRHFIRIVSGPIDELFQLHDETAAVRARDAYYNGEFFRFSTLHGRQCMVNFRQVQVVMLVRTENYPENIVSAR